MDAQAPQLREIILGRIANILKDVYRDPVSELSEDLVSAKLAFRADPQLDELRLALERIKRGEYGRCIFCKGGISDELLVNNPTAHFCEQCSGVLRYRTSTQRS
jgi:RNA polymerase-binding transcription factor DksA